MEDLDQLKPSRPIIPVAVQLLLFFLLWFMGALVGNLLFGWYLDLFVLDATTPIEDIDLFQPKYFIPMSALHALFGLLLPVLYFKRITRVRIWDFVQISPKLKGRWIVYTLLAAVVGLFAMEALAMLSEPIAEYLPSDYYFQLREETNEMYQALFVHSDVGQLVITLFVFALIPAVVEEVLFRGILFGKLMETSKGNIHFAAIVSGLLFAAVHQNPLDLLPITFMGVGFAYFYHYSKNLTYTIILHFLINGIQITAAFISQDLNLF